MKPRALAGCVIVVPSALMLIYCAVTYGRVCSRGPQIDAAQGRTISYSCRKLRNKVYLTEREEGLVTKWLVLSLLGVIVGGALAKDH